MALFDKPLEELRTYTPAREEQGDFDVFWSDTFAAARSYDLNAQFVPVDSGLRMLDVFDVTFNGYGGQPVKGWLILPSVREQPLPVVVEYIGYGGGRGLPIDWLLYASAGYAHFVMDTRGQGSAWSKGDTPDVESDGGNPQFPGFMTRGVLDPKTYYYRRVFTDGVRAVEAAMGHEWVDEMRVAVTGGSQGGGIALAVAGLSPSVLDDAVKVAMPDVPFLCHYRRATEIVDTHPYQEIVRFCKVQRDQIDTVFRTLSYFDGVNFAARATAQSLFSVAMMDDICPPSTVFAAYNHYQGPKDIRVWAFNNHEGGQAFQNVAKLQFLHDRWE